MPRRFWCPLPPHTLRFLNVLFCGSRVTYSSFKTPKQTTPGVMAHRDRRDREGVGTAWAINQRREADPSKQHKASAPGLWRVWRNEPFTGMRCCALRTCSARLLHPCGCPTGRIVVLLFRSAGPAASRPAQTGCCLFLIIIIITSFFQKSPPFLFSFLLLFYFFIFFSIISVSFFISKIFHLCFFPK